MTREERVKDWLDNDMAMNVFERAEWKTGIRELYHKAVAWNDLERRLPGYVALGANFIKTLNAIQSLMAELISPPKPKTKLERLKELVDTHKKFLWNYPGNDHGDAILLTDLLYEINKLEEEPDWTPTDAQP
jgi:hypothetical protein